MKIVKIVMVFFLFLVSSIVQANSDSRVECVDISKESLNIQDIIGPDFSNCYLFSNDGHENILVSVMIADGTEGLMEIQRYNASTNQLTSIKTKQTKGGTLSHVHQENIGDDFYRIHFANLTPALQQTSRQDPQKKRVEVAQIREGETIYLTFVFAPSPK